LESHLNEQRFQLGIFLLYTGKEEMDVSGLEQKVTSLFQKIIQDLNAKSA